MKTHQLAIGTLALLAAVAAKPALTALHANASNANMAGDATTVTSVALSAPRLRISGARGNPQQQTEARAKLDGALADLTRHADLVRPAHVLSDLHSMSPAARFMQRSSDAAPLILIDAVTRGDPQQLKTVLLALGLQHASVYSNDVSGWLPVNQIENAAAHAEVHSVRAAMPRTRVGAVTSQGDFAQRSDVIRATYSTLTGTGVTVGTISDSFNCYAVFAKDRVAATGAAGYASNGFLATAPNDVTSGDLPSGVNVVAEAPCMQTATQYTGYPDQLPFGDEGRAMLQIVHDVAPGASLQFYTAENGEADFASGIGKLAAAGSRIIADDVGYFDEPIFQDGLVAQAIDAVEAQGVAYFSATGNNGSNGYDNKAPSFTTLAAGTASPENLLNFDSSGATNSTSLPITIPALRQGDLIAVVVQWDQPYVTGAAGSAGATSQIDLCITGTSGGNVIENLDGTTEACTGLNATGSDPNQILIIANPANASAPTTTAHLNITLGLHTGTTVPGRIKLLLEDNGAGATIDNFATGGSPTLQGHPGAAGAAAVGAALVFQTPRCGTSTAVLERYSAEGGATILFDRTGTRLATPLSRTKPDFVAPDGGNDTFLGFKLTSDTSTAVSECANNAAYPNFLGTSAATPHAAAIAALMLQSNAALTPPQIYNALRMSALPMSSTTPDAKSGYGFVQADAALALLPPGPPALSVSPTSVAPGASATLTWSSINTTSCAASGGWSGTLQTSGTQAVTAPSTAGTASYTLTCTNPNGTSTATAATLAVATPSSGHGGGALGELTLLALTGLTFARLVRRTEARPKADQPAT